MAKSQIKSFFHCRKCIEEMPRGFISAQEYSRISVGMTDDERIQVWCDRHNCEIFHTEFVVPLVD